MIVATPLDLAQEPADAIGSYLSPSRLNLWLRCPRAWRLHYLEGILPATSPSLFLGSVVHWMLAVWYRHRQLGLTLDAPVVLQHLQNAWEALVTQETMRFSSCQEEVRLREQASGLVTAYLAQVPADEPRPMAVEVQLESPLIDPETGEDLGMPLVGILDLVLEAPDGPRIVDFKTAAKSTEALELLHEIQLSCYAWLVRQTSGQAESALEIRNLIKTKLPKVEFHQYPARTVQHFQRLFAVIRAYLDDLDRGQHLFRPGLHCRMCDYAGGPCLTWCP